MARRSAQNPRYQRDSDVGSTRKSAASAKPKRDVGESGGSGGKAKDKKSSRVSQVIPDTPEFHRWRKISVWLLVAGLIFTAGALGLRTQSPQVGTLLLFFAYSTLFSSIYIEWVKLRRMRKEWIEQTPGAKKNKEKADKAAKEKKSEESSDGDSSEGKE